MANTKNSSQAFEVVISKDPAESAGQYINELLARFLDTPVLLLLAGGSSRAVLDYIEEGFLTPDLTITVTDDRYSKELDENNFALLQATPFYNKAVQGNVYCINTEVWGDETIEDMRSKFEKNIRAWRSDFPEGKIIGLFGVGEDGHTAGIIPGVHTGKDFTKVFNGENLVASLDAEGKNVHRHRITTTLTFMRDWVDFGVFYAPNLGGSKTDALQRALGETTLEETPAAIMKEMKSVKLFTDIAVK